LFCISCIISTLLCSIISRNSTFSIAVLSLFSFYILTTPILSHHKSSIFLPKQFFLSLCNV
jgi:multisubunit Na+/H+ antiporter MnhG subunit